MACPHLSYRRSAGDRRFDEPRAYCAVADRFVQPMRADVCNDRYDLDHAVHCEIYREHEGGDAPGPDGDASESGGGASDADDGRP